MKNSSCIKEKQLVRKELIKIRSKISDARKKEAAYAACFQLKKKLSRFKNILSFYSIKSEININQLNQDLAKEQRLLLPKIEDVGLSAHRVTQLNQLHLSSSGLLEPHPNFSIPSALEDLDCILVPALGFDRLCHRIGYGKGHYDQLLQKLQHRPYTIGVGFQEQLCINPLPIEKHDISLHEILLF